LLAIIHLFNFSSDSNKENIAPCQLSDVVVKKSDVMPDRETSAENIFEMHEVSDYDGVSTEIELAKAEKENLMRSCVDRFLQSIVTTYNKLSCKQHSR